MSVIPLTIFFSLLLAGIFVVLFVREQHRRHLTSPERDSLLPLADEQSRPASPPRREDKRCRDPHDRAAASLPPGCDGDDYF